MGDSLRHAGRKWAYRPHRHLRAPPPSTKSEALERLFPALVSRILPPFFFCTERYTDRAIKRENVEVGIECPGEFDELTFIGKQIEII